ncbi:MAG: hypothetical protein EAZ70_01125 [Runella slithyformis]|nr:MAG: hypothetical protein EAZ70_01125 [Runella slithyformis]TAF48538.1 MAG: hypothetical protein EAZ63_04510 [Runella slithyformis]TAF83336.1 MAG: hypothetical protein EAZ50_01565 [Runella slithyformis]
MKTLKLSLFMGLLFSTHLLWAQLTVTIRTGGDDLRGGQAAFVQLLYRNNTISQEFDLNQGGGWGNNSIQTKSFQIQPVPNVADIAAVRIRYDGSPRKVPDTYDNWNLENLTVSLNGVQIAQCSGTPWHRFTGESTTRDCKVTVQPQIQMSFNGCWDSEWSDCNSNGKIAAGAKLNFKRDPYNKTRLNGAWGGHTDSNGYEHSGFLTGILRGNVLTGTWYEIIYKDNTECPQLTYSGTFQFVINTNNSFSGTWTDTNGPCKDSRIKMYWNGKR